MVLSRRQDILEVAAQLFMSKGYAETSIRDIATDAGVRPASLYHYFASKDDLLAEIMVAGITAVKRDVMLAWDERRKATAREFLQIAICAHLRSLFDHGPCTAVAVMLFHVAPADVKVRVLPIRDSYDQLWDQVLAEVLGLDATKSRRDTAFPRLALLGALNSALEWFDRAGPQSIDELATSIADTFWGGLAASAPIVSDARFDSSPSPGGLRR
jgi:AcrR family transcriptional regulator